MRCFISINIPENIKKEILKIQSQLPEFKGKKTEFENLHLTLKFLGEINKEMLQKVKDRLSSINFKKFKTQIDSIGHFDNTKSRFNKSLIIWLHLTNCEKLQKEIDNSLENIFPKEKRFMSHLTIARIKSVRNRKDFLETINKIKVPEINFDVDKFYLMSSEVKSKGPEYKIIEEYSLI